MGLAGSKVTEGHVKEAAWAVKVPSMTSLGQSVGRGRILDCPRGNGAIHRARRQRPSTLRVWRALPRMKPLRTFLCSIGGILGAVAATPSAVEINWLGGTPAPAATGVSWGVPWSKGAVQKAQAFTLTGADGKALPLQTWPLAYWPDG